MSSWNNDGKSRVKRKARLGTLWKGDPKHPVANCHVYRVEGKSWKLIPGHYTQREAIGKAQELTKKSKDTFVAQRKGTNLWPPSFVK